jgi:hypothetical protein
MVEREMEANDMMLETGKKMYPSSNLQVLCNKVVKGLVLGKF